MFDIRVKDVVLATGGTLLCGDENQILEDVCIDSRAIKEGDLFVPLVGEKVDAHKFIEKTMEIAAATLTAEHDAMESEKAYIHVDDTLKAFQKLGSYMRSRFQIPFVGVTGSVGKTTTREMIATALSGQRKTYQTEKNYNSQVGVPIAISRIPQDTEISVLEMGMSAPGEMHTLSTMIRPSIGVVTIIGVAHIEQLKTQENIRKEKLSIMDEMDPNGVMFLNGEDPLLREVHGTLPIESRLYGFSEECEYRAENISREGICTGYDYVHGETRVHVVLNAMGQHNVLNSVVAMAIAEYEGLDLVEAAKSLLNFEGQRQRLIEVPGKYKIIDDTYNASPDSMKASLNVLEDIEVSGRKIAVLADMLELGPDSAKLHYDVGSYLATKKIDELIVVGEMAQNILQAVKDAGVSMSYQALKDNGEVELYLLSVMKENDIVLLKGSNGMKLKSVVERLVG